jgi:hypothetical protein
VKNIFIIFILFITVLGSCSTGQERQQSRVPSGIFSFLSCGSNIKSFFLGGQLLKETEVITIGKGQLSGAYGIELELFKPDSISHEDIANDLFNFFKLKNFKDVKIEKETANWGTFNYVIHYQKDGELRSWGVPHEPDMYVSSKKDVIGIELTTPIMRTEEDFEIYKEVVAFLDQKGLTSAKNIGGVHVHVGTEFLTLADFFRVTSALDQSYIELKKYFKPDKGRRGISSAELMMGNRRLRERVEKRPDALAFDVYEGMSPFSQGPIRYNRGFQTIEFRFFNSTTNIEELLFFKEFSVRFMQKSLEDDEFLENIAEMSYPEIFESLAFKSWPKVK